MPGSLAEPMSWLVAVGSNLTSNEPGPEGKGRPRDMEQAAGWYRKAAEQGDVGAQATLGLLYSLGQGVAKSDVEAYFWVALAASVKGPKQEQYAQNRQLIGTHITTDELEEVQERVAKWQAAHPRPGATE